MATFITALTWGLGASCGAAVGLLAFSIVHTGLQWLFGKHVREAIDTYNVQSLEALERRNRLTVGYIDATVRIAEAMEKQTSSRFPELDAEDEEAAMEETPPPHKDPFIEAAREYARLTARRTADDVLDSLPNSSSHIQSVPTPAELIRAGEEAMEKEMRAERRKPMP